VASIYLNGWTQIWVWLVSGRENGMSRGKTVLMGDSNGWRVWVNWGELGGDGGDAAVPISLAKKICGAFCDEIASSQFCR